MLLPHLCFDIDGTLTHKHVYDVSDVTDENMKGGRRFGDIANKAIEIGFPISILTFKEDEILVNKILQQAGVGADELQAMQIVAFKPLFAKEWGKRVHCEQACQMQYTNNGHEMIMRPHIIFEDNQNNARLFKRDGGHSVLVNGDEFHLDVFESIIKSPLNAIAIVESHENIASETYDRCAFFVR